MTTLISVNLIWLPILCSILAT